MSAIVRVEAGDVRSRLAELGLEEEPLRDVVRRGYLAFTRMQGAQSPTITF